LFVPSNLPASSIDRPSEVDVSREASDIGAVMRCSSNTTELARNWFADLAPEIFDWNTSALSDNNNPSITLGRPFTIATRRSPKDRVRFNERAKSLEFEMGKSKLSEVAEQYSKQFAKLGWTTDGRGINADDYTFLTFRKEKIEIDLRARIKEGNAVVSIQGEGLLWSKPLPGSDKVISFESWLRKNSYPAGLGLIAAYEKEMRQIMSK